VHRKTVFAVEDRRRVPFLLLILALGIVGGAAGTLLFVIGESASLLDIMSSMTVLEMRILSARLEKLADLLISGSSGVYWLRVVVVDSMRAMVHVLMLMLSADV
jgi:hypothetical protein